MPQLRNPGISEGYYNKGTGRYVQVPRGAKVAPEWDRDYSSVPDGCGVISVSGGATAIENEPLRPSVNGRAIYIMRGVPSVVPSEYISLLMNHCIETQFTQPQLTEAPIATDVPRFPISVIVPPKGDVQETIEEAVSTHDKFESAPHKKPHNGNRKKENDVIVEDE